MVRAVVRVSPWRLTVFGRLGLDHLNIIAIDVSGFVAFGLHKADLLFVDR